MTILTRIRNIFTPPPAQAARILANHRTEADRARRMAMALDLRKCVEAKRPDIVWRTSL